MPANANIESGEGHASAERDAVRDQSGLPPNIPRYEDLKPRARRRSVRGGPELSDISLMLETVTPVFGGGAVARELADDLDAIRVPSVRGQLRLWWRALHGHDAAYADDPRKLFADEAAIFGSAASDANGGRSLVEVRIDDVDLRGTVDDTDPMRSEATAYALWPARGTRDRPQHLSRRRPGTRFRLTLIFPKSPVDGVPLEPMLRNALRAWILFGGYGSRTRRGLGSLTAVGDSSTWLPQAASREAITRLFDRDIFAAAGGSRETPLLAGAALYTGSSAIDRAEQAWAMALDWLKEFRQGTKSGARNSPPPGAAEPRRASTSNWPEADKLRHLSSPMHGLPWAHTPRYDATPAWPRAGFGLPIIGQFQQNSRVPRAAGERGTLRWRDLPAGHSNRGDEPRPFELRWHDGSRPRDRLASPLVVKALPLAGGKYLPMALWFNRSYPRGRVVLKDRTSGENGALFDAPYAVPGGVPAFIATAGTHSLRQAFLDWLAARATMVAP